MSGFKTIFVKINFKPTHQAIADLVGASRQTVTEALNDLEEKGVISFNKKDIQIRDLKKLAGYAGTKLT